MLNRRVWKTISPRDYQLAFDRFGGSFAVHPRVVDLLASLAERPVRYAGLRRGGEIVAAAPLWGEHIVATKLALASHGASHLLDVGDSEVVLPVAEGASIELPFKADMISGLHAGSIAGLERETDFVMTLAKGLQAGDRRLSGKSQARRRRETRRLEKIGGRFTPIGAFSPREAAAIYTGLFEKRWGFPPLGKELLTTVLSELSDLLCGDVLLIGDRPAAIELVYRSVTPRWLLASGVNRGVDPEFRDYSPGSVLLFHNIQRLEEEACAAGKTLRFSFGRNDADYKEMWSFEAPAYRLDPPPRKILGFAGPAGLLSLLRRGRGRAAPFVEQV